MRGGNSVVGDVSITISGDTAMTLTVAAADVSNNQWTFDVAERLDALAGTAMLEWQGADFANDIVNLNLAEGSDLEWTLIDAAASAVYGRFDVLIDGESILPDTLALDEKISDGEYAGWGFTLDDSTLKFKHLA